MFHTLGRSLSALSTAPQGLSRILKSAQEQCLGVLALYRYQQLTNANFLSLIRHPKPQEFAQTLYYLNRFNLLHHHCLVQALINSKHPIISITAIAMLENTGLFQEVQTLQGIIEHQSPTELATAFLRLYNHQLINDAVLRDGVLTHPDPTDLAFAICKLKSQNLLWENNYFTLVLNHLYPSQIGHAISTLHQANLLDNTVLFTTICRHPRPESAAMALRELHRQHLIHNEQILEVVLAHSSPFDIARAICLLHSQALLSDAPIFSAIIEHQRIANLVFAMQYLNALNLFRREYLVAVLGVDDPLVGVGLLVIALRDQGLAPHPQLPRQPINHEQSTHTRSVHESVSESVLRLWALYGQHMNLTHVLDDVQQFIGQLPDLTLQNCAAKRAVTQILMPEYQYIDKGSQCSVKEVLALAFLAIHDEDRRIGTLEDALERFIEGLYEIQRGYNLDDDNHDNGLRDVPICVGGAFNKIVSQLVSIHPAVSIHFINHALALEKAQIVVMEEAYLYLSSLNLNTCEAYLHLIALIERLEETANLTAIFEFIRDKVKTRLFLEFGCLYRGIEDPRFIDWINGYENGFLSSEQLATLKGYAQNAEGYRLSLSGTAPATSETHQNRFFKFVSPEAPEEENHPCDTPTPPPI